MPEIFNWLQENGNVEQMEMYKTFNCGVGMVLVVAYEDLQTAINTLNESGESAWHIGEIKDQTDGSQVSFY